MDAAFRNLLFGLALYLVVAAVLLWLAWRRTARVQSNFQRAWFRALVVSCLFSPTVFACGGIAPVPFAVLVGMDLLCARILRCKPMRLPIFAERIARVRGRCLVRRSSSRCFTVAACTNQTGHITTPSRDDARNALALNASGGMHEDADQNTAGHRHNPGHRPWLARSRWCVECCRMAVSAQLTIVQVGTS
jgi:putative component of membrane protein insertase Oxa1/YidC/SpoIIIJ protein YidD